MAFCHQFFQAFLIGGTIAIIGFLINKIEQHDDENEELFLRLEECEKNS